jgi:hypothetical protein
MVVILSGLSQGGIVQGGLMSQLVTGSCLGLVVQKKICPVDLLLRPRYNIKKLYLEQPSPGKPLKAFKELP